MDPNIQFVTGMPRSGSTLLMNILGQNPAHHVTPTNDLVDLIVTIRDRWTNDVGFRSQGLENIKPRVLGSLRGQIYGFYEQEFDEGQVVFDKSRGWIAYIELLEEILQRPVKMIVTVRDVRAVCASFEKIHREGVVERPRTPPPAFFEVQTIDGRTRHLMSNGGVVGITINRVRDALERGMADRLLFIRYNRLVSRPKETLDALHDALELPRFDYDFENVKQLTHEDDTVHGMWHLHEIREGKVEPPYTEAPPWEGVLPSRVAEGLARDFGDINRIANEPSPLEPSAQPQTPPNLAGAESKPEGDNGVEGEESADPREEKATPAEA